MLPLLAPSLIAATMLVFAIAMRELVASILLAPVGTQTISTFIWKQFEQGSLGLGMAMSAVAIIVSSLGGILLSLMHTLPLLALTGLVWQAFSIASGIASVAWLKDLLPEQNRGKFLGIRMIFWIAIPMVAGPWIGSTLIRNFGIPTIANGEAGFIPVPIIFQVGSMIALLSLIPLGFIRWEKSA